MARLAFGPPWGAELGYNLHTGVAELVATAQMALAHTAVCPNCMRSVPFFPADNPLSKCPQGCWRKLHNTVEWTGWYSPRLGYRFVLEATRVLAWEKRPPYTLVQAQEANFDESESSDDSSDRGGWGATPGMDRRRHFRRYYFYCRGIRKEFEANALGPMREERAPAPTQAPALNTGSGSGQAQATRMVLSHALWQTEACGYVAAIAGMRGVVKLAETSRTVCAALLAFGRAQLANTTICPHCECSYPWAAGEYCRFDVTRLRTTAEWMEAEYPQRSLRYMLHAFDVLDNEGIRPYTAQATVREWFDQGSEDSEHTDM